MRPSRAEAHRRSNIVRVFAGGSNYTAVLSNRLSQTIASKVPSSIIRGGTYRCDLCGNTRRLCQRHGKFRFHHYYRTQCLRTVSLTTIVFSGLALVLSFFVPNVEDRLTGDVVATLHNRDDEKVIGT